MVTCLPVGRQGTRMLIKIFSLLFNFAELASPVVFDKQGGCSYIQSLVNTGKSVLKLQ